MNRSSNSPSPRLFYCSGHREFHDRGCCCGSDRHQPLPIPLPGPTRRLVRCTTHVYFDGFNLYYSALKKTPYKRLDLEALGHRLLRRDQIAYLLHDVYQLGCPKP